MENYKEIVLTCGNICIVDEEDFEVLSKHKWRLVGAGYVSRNICSYKPVKKQKTLYMHKFLLPCEKGEEVDHINGNKLDNRKCNLKKCSRIENCRKRPKCTRIKHSQTSKYKGVSFHKKYKKFRARIYFEGKEVFLGQFEREIDAAKEYNKAALTYFKEYAILNEIEE